MIGLLALQVSVVLSDADRTSFKDYRDCVLQNVVSADLRKKDRSIVKAAQKSCEDDRSPAGLELQADDLEREGLGEAAPPIRADARMKLMEDELVAQALSALADRRTEAQ